MPIPVFKYSNGWLQVIHCAGRVIMKMGVRFLDGEVPSCSSLIGQHLGVRHVLAQSRGDRRGGLLEILGVAGHRSPWELISCQNLRFREWVCTYEVHHVQGNLEGRLEGKLQLR